MVLMAIGGGFQLNTPAGLAYLRARRDGCPAGINSATRSYSQQLDWYLNQGKKGYPKKADNPNRSKHVWRPNDLVDKGARALDLPEGGPQEWMRKHGHKYGWMKDRVSGEKWHFEYEEWNDQSRFDNDGDEDMPSLTEIHDVVVSILRAPEFDLRADDRAWDIISRWYIDLLGRAGGPTEISSRVADIVQGRTTYSQQYASIFNSAEAKKYRDSQK